MLPSTSITASGGLMPRVSLRVYTHVHIRKTDIHIEHVHILETDDMIVYISNHKNSTRELL